MKIKTLILSLGISIPMLMSASQGEDKPHYHAAYSNQYTQDLMAPVVEPGLRLYVSVDGKDKWKGTEKKPFQTLEAARDVIRALKAKNGLPKGGVEVIIKEGTYDLKQALVLDEQDGGTKESPIVYRGISQNKVILNAGKSLDTKELKLVDDEKHLAYLHEKAKGKVMSIDLAGKDVAKMFPGEGKYGAISMNGYMLQIAQWPNRGYNHIGTFVELGPTTRWLKPGEKPMPYSKENPTGGKFILKEALSPLVAAEFKRSGDMRAQGYFHNDWYFQDEPVGAFKGEEIQLLHHTRYGIVNKIKTVPRRVRLLNVLAELDEPGEWYFDKKEERLYVWPIKGFEAGKSNLTVIGSTNESINEAGINQPGEKTSKTRSSILSLNNTSYVTFRDVTMENSADLAVEINGGEYNLLAAAVVRNGSGRGLAIKGGKHNGVTGSDFYDLYSAFTISGGDFVSLEWAHNFATNNEIRSCRLRGYGVISIDGVGHYFAHNLLHSMNGAVMYKTVDMLMEYNEYYNIGYEMGDFNVAYCGAQWYTMNNVLRYNFVHHIIEPGGHPITAFRNDDNGAGMKIYGNVFYRPGRGSCIFHGFLNDFQNNITLHSSIMWWTLKKPIDAEGIQARWDDLAKFGRDLPKGDKGDYIYIMEQIIGKDGWKKGAWKERFPELEATIDKNPWAQTNCTVSDNYAFDVRKTIYIHGGDGTVEGLEVKKQGNFKDLPHDEIYEYPQKVEPSDAFVSVEKMDFNFKKDYKVMDGFKLIPFDKIGLVKDQYRTHPKDKNVYRPAVYQKFKDDKGGRYNAELVNSRYPVKEYLK